MKLGALENDEIWSFCYSKQKNVPVEKRGLFGYGDVWTWTGIDADTKLVPCWHVGRRNARAPEIFLIDVASRLTNRVQLTTDGFGVYIRAVEEAFENDIDYAMLVKKCGEAPESKKRYSRSDGHSLQAGIVRTAYPSFHSQPYKSAD